MKVLNLYAGIGGNRALWPDSFEVTAIEYDPEIARAYKNRFPHDTVFVADAHSYLIDNISKFDFIWTSPPCPSHGQYRYNIGVRAKGYKPLYPDMKLYEEIILLQYHAPGKWAVENTISYYEPLIKPQKIARHYIWSNFHIPELIRPADGLRSRNKIKDCEEHVGFSLEGYNIKNKRQVLRNCVDKRLGKHVSDQLV